MSEIMALSCLSLDDTSLSSGALAHNLQHCDPVQGHGPGCLNGILVHCQLCRMTFRLNKMMTTLVECMIQGWPQEAFLTMCTNSMRLLELH